MTRARSKRPRIEVDQRTRMERWDAAGRRLNELDRPRFDKALALAEAYVAAYDRPLESEGEFQARLELATGARSMGSN